MSNKIIDVGLTLGFARVGTTSISDFVPQRVRLDEFLKRGYAGQMDYLRMPGGSRGDIQTVFKEARGVISVALPYETPVVLRRKDQSPEQAKQALGNSGYVAKYARGLDYHRVVRELLLELADMLADLVQRPVRSRPCVDTAPLFERDIAERAGVAFLGKNTLAIAPGLGSRFVLGELLVDVELTETLKKISDGCGSCRACLDICPTGAFVDERLMDARKCISYLTIEHRGPIPRELRAKIGTHLFGCDLCQAVCPYNHGSHPLPAHPQLSSARLSQLDLGELLQVGSAGYKRLVQGTALRRINKEQFCRNVAVALGNQAQLSDVSVSALVRALENHPSELVREHCAWALVELSKTTARSDVKQAVELLAANINHPGHPWIRDELAARTHDSN